MISRLRLINFGKFRGRDLNLGPFTVITGGNEAGKTTVFDAIFDGLCKSNKTKVVWQRLSDRYGDGRLSSLTWEPEESKPVLDEAEFLEIFAIRGGTTSVRAVSGEKGTSAWARVAENTLLNAGLNPDRLADDLEKRSTRRAEGTFNYRIAALKERLEQARTELSALLAKRQAISEAEKQCAALDGEMTEKKSELAAEEKKLEELKAEAEKLSNACRLKEAVDGLRSLRELKETKEKLASMSAFSNNEAGAYRALRDRQTEAAAAASSFAAALREKEAAAAAFKKAKADLTARVERLAKRRSLADDMAARLAAFSSGPEVLTMTPHLPTRLGIWAIGAALAALVAWSGHNTPAYIAAALLLAGAGWAGYKLSLKPTLAGHNPAEVKNFIDGLAAEWKNTLGEAMNAEKLEQLRALFARAVAEHDAAKEALAAKEAETADIAGGLKAAAETLAKREADDKSLADAALAWLRARGCGTEEDYQAKVTEQAGLQALADSLGQRALLLRRELNAPDEEELRQRLLDVQEALNNKGVDAAEADKPKLEKKLKQRDTLAENVAALKAQLAELKTGFGSAKAQADTLLAGIPEDINRLRKEIAAGEQDIAGMELAKEACQLASGVFRDIAASSSAIFADLGREVSATLARVMPASAAEFGDFDALTASVKDAGGQKRPIDHLSTGTQDLFMLAARVALARKARKEGDGPALLVLDEPFYTLDETRMRAALSLLADFHKESGWQVLILTKDDAIAGQAARLPGLNPALISL